MIISHAHEFVFIKTRKTAGTSIEVALAPLCGPDDVVTGIGEDDASHHGVAHAARNDEGIRNHGSIAEVKDLPGVSGYFKFAFERNPWDKVVSQFWFKKRKDKFKDSSFEDWFATMAKRTHRFPVDHDKYTVDGALAVDFVGRYENLQADVDGICERLGLPPLELPRLKSQFRKSRAPYREYYDDRARDIVAEAFATEIELFGYEF